ncbi:MAG: c-type cytochrome [Chloroflexi bacterium]|nr:c-type cytochrome [Chloroflexota bacterium]
MIGTIISLLILVALVALFAWLARRAWGAKRAWLKWPGVVLAGLFTLLLGLLTAVGAIGVYKLYAPRNVPVPAVTVQGTPPTSGQIARGQHLAEVLCVACHSTNDELPLSGGDNLAAETGLPLGDIYGPNLTPAGELKDWSDGEVFRVIRTGVNKDGRATFMGGIGSRLLSDEDTQAIVAYLRASPSVQNETPEFKPTLLLALFTGAGLLNFEPPAATGPIAAPSKAVTFEYGKYVVDFVSCDGCHGPKLDGNAPPPAPPAPNLTVILPQWSKEDFFTAMRTGVTPSGEEMDPVAMPWKAMGKLDDVELEALYLYLHGLTPVTGK